MGNLSLAEAFASFGGKPRNRLYGTSAIAADGAMILTCSGGRYAHPAPGVLRYEDRLSRDPGRPAESRLLAENLGLAREGELPVRMIVLSRQPPQGAGKATQRIHVRPDLVGKVTQFDGDHFIVDFVRIGRPAPNGKRSGDRS